MNPNFIFKLLIIHMLILQHISIVRKEKFVFKSKEECNKEIYLPESSLTCSRFTTDTDSCCFYSFGSQTGCFFLGQSLNGVYEKDGLKIVCFSLKNHVFYMMIIVYIGFLLV